MLIALIFSESFLLELGQRDLRWKDFQIDAKEMIALLNDILNDLVVV